MPAILEFKPTGQGWAGCTIRLDQRTFTLSGISDITDVFGDLTRMALAIVTGAYRATTSFDQEPIEWRIVATSQMDDEGNGPVSIAVYDFERMSDAPLSAGRLCFIGDCEARDFAKATLEGVRHALSNPRLLGFTYFPPPTKALAALAYALGDS